jgi:hypothetical protein
MPPMSSDPSTISTVAESPTASESRRSVTLEAASAAASSVTRPRPSVTTSRVRVGSRLPSTTPIPDPTRTVATLTTVPRPRNIDTTSSSETSGKL